MDKRKDKQTENPKAATGFRFAPKAGRDATGTGSGAKTPPPSEAPAIDDVLSAMEAEDDLDSTSKSSTAVPTPVDPDSPRITKTLSVREERLPCSFPGLLKLLVPERSFVPTTVPVRVANLSATGAMVEVHDNSNLDKELALANRFFELKIAHPEIPTLRGTVAWSDLSGQKALLGLALFERLEQFSKVILADDSTRGFKGPPPLSPPQIDPYPPRTSDVVVTIAGKAPEALEVVAKGDERRFKAPVVNGRFELRLELTADQENHFSIRSFAGARKSRALPIRIVNEAHGRPRPRRVFDLQLKADADGTNIVELEFSGGVHQAERILYRLSQLMANSERIAIFAALETPGTFDRRLYDSLMNEGRLLMAETGQSKAAAKLLDELL